MCLEQRERKEEDLTSEPPSPHLSQNTIKALPDETGAHGGLGAALDRAHDGDQAPALGWWDQLRG